MSGEVVLGRDTMIEHEVLGDAEGMPDTGVGSAPSPDGLRWQRSYDRASVDRFLAEVEAERARLKEQIDRASAARAAADQVEVDAAGRLGGLVLSAWNELVRIEDEHREIITTIRDAAEAEAARVLAAAHREVEAMRTSTASLAALLHEAEGIDDPGAHVGAMGRTPESAVDPAHASAGADGDRADAG